MHPFKIAFLFSLFWSFCLCALTYCSSDNTGSGLGLSYTYQSNGYCSNECYSGYLYAILLGTRCWCSNTLPATGVDVNECNTPCNGYPYDKCGNLANGLYGYIYLGKDTPPTINTISFQSTTSEASTLSSNSDSYSLPSDTGSLSSMHSISTSISVHHSTSNLSSGSSTFATPTKTNAKISTVYSVETITASISSFNQVSESTYVTKIITTIYPSSQDISNNTTNNDSIGNKSTSGSRFFNSPGKVAGTFLGVGFLILLLIALMGYIWYRHKRNLKERDFEKNYDAAIGNNTITERSSSSTLTHVGFIYTDEKGIQRSPKGHIRGNSTLNSISHTTDTNFDDIQIVVDQRLDPRHVMSKLEEGGSKISLSDEVDYSRKVLRVINE